MLSYLLWLSSEVKTMSSDREKKRLVLRLVFTTSGSSDLTETKASVETCLYDKWVIRFDGDFYDKRPVR